MKIILKIFISIILILLIITTYLSTIGIETDRFNNQIKDKIKSIDKKTEIQLKKIKLVLDPFELKIKFPLLVDSTNLASRGIISINGSSENIKSKSCLLYTSPSPRDS